MRTFIVTESEHFDDFPGVFNGPKKLTLLFAKAVSQYLKHDLQQL